jgi:tyrosine-protein phosphatase SIW14
LPVPTVLRWLFGGIVVLLVAVAPVVYYRYSYTYAKRLRVVTPGYVYRSGQMTAAGFRDAVAKHKIRTVINLQDDYPDPEVACGYFCGGTIRESDLCRQLGVRYVALAPDLISPRLGADHRPRVIEQFLKILDDPRSYPVLLHCKAGLHRTGCLTAVYRMEYNGWSNAQALRELKDNGFGEFTSSSANEYIRQYVINYRPGFRGQTPAIRNQGARAPSQTLPSLEAARKEYWDRVHELIRHGVIFTPVDAPPGGWFCPPEALVGPPPLPPLSFPMDYWN